MLGLRLQSSVALDRIISSDLSRAKQTARESAKLQNLEVKLNEQWCEKTKEGIKVNFWLDNWSTLFTPHKRSAFSFPEKAIWNISSLTSNSLMDFNPDFILR